MWMWIRMKSFRKDRVDLDHKELFQMLLLPVWLMNQIQGLKQLHFSLLCFLGPFVKSQKKWTVIFVQRRILYSTFSRLRMTTYKCFQSWVPPQGDTRLLWLIKPLTFKEWCIITSFPFSWKEQFGHRVGLFCSIVKRRKEYTGVIILSHGFPLHLELIWKLSFSGLSKQVSAIVCVKKTVL